LFRVVVFLQLLNHIKIRCVETRTDDTWYDMSLRKMRNGEVNFYVVKDFLTGEWLFKLCKDKELEKITVKSLKCPSGIQFSQLEGKSMVFQKSKIEGMLYDVISLSELTENNELKRNVVSSIEEIPDVIKENFMIKSYEEATGKKAPGKHLVTLSNPENEKDLVTLFVLERAWGLSESTPQEILNEKEQTEQKKKATKKETDTGQNLTCPICGKTHRLIHIETEKNIKHTLRKMR
jgi:hypothetical protein